MAGSSIPHYLLLTIHCIKHLSLNVANAKEDVLEVVLLLEHPLIHACSKFKPAQ